jgi:hypothetical protein
VGFLSVQLFSQVFVTGDTLLIVELKGYLWIKLSSNSLARVASLLSPFQFLSSTAEIGGVTLYSNTSVSGWANG